jgi:large subunit ribosomal protein L23
MDLSIYDVIVGPVISEKAYRLNRLFKKLALKVHPAANKPMVKEALEKLFSVKVKKISIVVRKGKNRRVRGRATTGKLSKRAIITLAEGYSLDFMDQAGSRVVHAETVKE